MLQNDMVGTMITDHQENAIIEFAYRIYDSLDYTHGRSHAKRTEKLAIHLAKEESANVLVSRLGALLHQYHPERVDDVDSFLKSINLDLNLRLAIIHCVECVEPETISNAKTIEAKIVFDADKLQTLGAYGLIREVCYRVHRDGINFDSAVEKAQELQEIIQPLIQTVTGKKYVSELQKEMDQFYQSFEKWSSLHFL